MSERFPQKRSLFSNGRRNVGIRPGIAGVTEWTHPCFRRNNYKIRDRHSSYLVKCINEERNIVL